ncbi:MAG: imelysin family protein [Campylobacterota bacterium]|nr:imelysin family protein [Campylobacterota bacterium]
MKKNITLSLLLVTLLSVTGCDDENAYNGQTGLIGGGSSTVETTENSSLESSIISLYSLIKEDSANAYINSLEMLQSLNTLQSNPNELTLRDAQTAFKKLTLSYKRVETFYVAGANDANMKDIAEFYIEQYIKQSKNYDVVADLDAVFSSNKTIVKNDLKGLTALEYTLFGNAESLSSLNEKMDEKRLDSALIMANNIVKRFKSIDEYYKADTTFLSDSDAAIGTTLNVLVQQAFNLREWRIGEPAGFTLKYKDDPSTSRLEYHRSLNSLESIKEILDTHKKIMNSGLKNIAILGNSTSEAEAILTAIDDALALCETYPSSLVDGLANDETFELYETIRTLQNNYTALINALNFRQDLLEADGD